MVPVVSVAAALDLDGNRIRRARVALGGVAHKPWRVPEAEQMLSGQAASPAAFQRAARRMLEGAKPYTHNAFKIPVAEQAIVRALTIAGGVA